LSPSLQQCGQCQRSTGRTVPPWPSSGRRGLAGRLLSGLRPARSEQRLQGRIASLSFLVHLLEGLGSLGRQVPVAALALDELGDGLPDGVDERLTLQLGDEHELGMQPVG
jgi:hypothetical protein